MSRAHRTLPRSLRYFLLVGAAFAATLTLSQCQLVEDSVTAPGRDILVSSVETARDCFARCNQRYVRDLSKEMERHRRALRRCRLDPACISAENALYAANLAKIDAEKKQCIDDCHHQGGGYGGR